MNQKRVRFLQIYLVILVVLFAGPRLWHLASTSPNQAKKNKALFDAILRNNTAGVKAAINSGADVNAEMEGWSWTDFVHPMTAAMNGDIHIHLRDTPLLASLDSLIPRAAPDAADKETGKIPVENLEIVKALVEAGADINARGTIGSTALDMAVEWRYNNTVNYLLTHKADPNIADNGGMTPLHFIAMSGSAVMMENLLKHGAKVNATDILGSTALDDAARMSDSPTLDKKALLLLQHGADPNLRDNDGLTPLKRARANKSSALVQILLEHGAK